MSNHIARCFLIQAGGALGLLDRVQDTSLILLVSYLVSLRQAVTVSGIKRVDKIFQLYKS